MKQTKQGVRSTKIVDEDAMLGVKQQPGVKHKDVYLMVFDATKKSMFSNQTGKFPITSARGNKYIMVAVELDGIISMANRSSHGQQNHSPRHIKPFSSIGRQLESSA